jgi:D-glycero-D-manno-heptose 1,7-bisphosphate phosphatase
MIDKAAFLDRDGVLNNIIIKDGLPYSPSKYDEFKILPGVKDSITKLKKMEFRCIVVTNQPDVSRGKIKKETVVKMNNYLNKELELDDIFVCFHDDIDKCNCRKPKPGLIFEAAKKWNINLKKSYMIGDRWKDIDAGTSSGCKTIFLNNNYKEKVKSEPNFTCENLLKAVNLIEKNETN